MQSILFQGRLIQIKDLDLSKLIILKEPQLMMQIFAVFSVDICIIPDFN